MSKRKPSLIVVTGRPGSGKTTLAHLLANQIHCPVLCRDEFKEGFIHTVGGSHESLGKQVNWEIYETFFETIDYMVSKKISLVVEAAFQHKLWAPKLRPLMQLANIVIVLCAVAPDLARSRSIARGLTDSTRERFHGDQAALMDNRAKEGTALPLANYQPPELPVPILSVDTTNGYSPVLDQILRFAMPPNSAIDL